jgi:hypothetical protein
VIQKCPVAGSTWAQRLAAAVPPPCQAEAAKGLRRQHRGGAGERGWREAWGLRVRGCPLGAVDRGQIAVRDLGHSPRFLDRRGAVGKGRGLRGGGEVGSEEPMLWFLRVLNEMSPKLKSNTKKCM